MQQTQADDHQTKLEGVQELTKENNFYVDETIRIVKTPLEESKTEESQTEESKTEESKTEESKTEESKTEESKTEEFKTEESKTEEIMVMKFAHNFC